MHVLCTLLVQFKDCVVDLRIVMESLNLRFVLDNPQIVLIHTLGITCCVQSFN